MDNLLQALPEKTEKERIVIAKRFYKNLTDMFIETIKMISASNKFLAKRFTANWKLLQSLEPTGKSVQVHLGHNFNWEWGNSILFCFLSICPGVYPHYSFMLRSLPGKTPGRAENL